MKKITRYRCEGCDKEYEIEAEALKCEAKGIAGFTRPPKIGDVVTCGTPYGWHDRPRTPWAKRRKSREAISGYWYDLLYVVSHINTRNHQRIYHLFTPCNPEGREVAGYTCLTHIRPRKLRTPPKGVLLWLKKNKATWEGRTGHENPI